MVCMQICMDAGQNQADLLLGDLIFQSRFQIAGCAEPPSGALKTRAQRGARKSTEAPKKRQAPHLAVSVTATMSQALAEEHDALVAARMSATAHRCLTGWSGGYKRYTVSNS